MDKFALGHATGADWRKTARATLTQLAGNSGGANVVYVNDGAGNFSVGDFGSGDDVDLTAAVVLGDVDFDGDADIVFVNSGSTNVLHVNDGAGNFTGGLGLGIITLSLEEGPIFVLRARVLF